MEEEEEEEGGGGCLALSCSYLLSPSALSSLSLLYPAAPLVSLFLSLSLSLFRDFFPLFSTLCRLAEEGESRKKHLREKEKEKRKRRERKIREKIFFISICNLIFRIENFLIETLI